MCVWGGGGGRGGGYKMVGGGGGGRGGNKCSFNPTQILAMLKGGGGGHNRFFFFNTGALGDTKMCVCVCVFPTFKKKGGGAKKVIPCLKGEGGTKSSGPDFFSIL